MKQKVIEQFAKPFFDIYQKEMNSVLSSTLTKLKSPAKQKKILQKIERNQKIKTIWHTERPLLLSSIYYPTSILSAEFNARPVKSLSELPTNFSIFLGTAGQGKSVFLKHLIEGEILFSNRIPLFIEARDYKGGDFERYIFDFFASLFEDVEYEIFNLFCRHGKISFLIDGFDEIDEAYHALSLKGINILSEKYPLCRIALTSRPDYACEFLTNFNNYNLKPLETNDLKNFYKKLTRDVSFTEKLYQAIITSPTKIKDLVKTPLLATLLAISYKSAQKIPLEFSEFYDQLFQILLIRHDGAKLGWHRERKSKLTDEEMQRIFEAVCFNSRKRGSINFTKNDFLDLTKKAIDSTLISCREIDYLSDIKKITCLIVSEAQGYSFIHASVPEFFSAKYIKSLSEKKVIVFYGRMLSGKWKRWRPELYFLEQIDNFRYIKHFQTPDIINALKLIGLEGDFPKEKIVDFLCSIKINKIYEQRDSSDVPYIRYVYNHPMASDGYYLWTIVSRAVGLCTAGSQQNWISYFEEDDKRRETNLFNIISRYPLENKKEILALIENFINGLKKKISENVKRIAALEEINEFDDI